MEGEINKIWEDTDDNGAEKADYQRIYLEELKSIPLCTPDETEKLQEAVLKGDAAAGKRLVEGHLMAAVRIAGDYLDRGLPLSDLIQEANMALLIFAGEYKGGDFDKELEKEIRSAIETALDSQETEAKIEEEMLARVNVLKDISAGMTDELGREATVTELAERMRMTEEEIKDIMKLTLDAMSLSGE